jgi:hypothetical protein
VNETRHKKTISLGECGPPQHKLCRYVVFCVFGKISHYSAQGIMFLSLCQPSQIYNPVSRGRKYELQKADLLCHTLSTRFCQFYFFARRESARQN